MGAKHANRKADHPYPKKGRARGSPLTTTPDYDADELEFFKAVEKWKRDKRKQFPSLSELLGVLKELGWRKEPKGAINDGA